MSKNRKRDALSPSSLSELQQRKQELGVIEMQLIEKALRSSNPSSIIEAQEYIKKGKKNQSQLMSFTFAPEHEFYSGQGYKQKWNAISYDLLRGTAATPQIVGVVQTRIDQALNFSAFTTDLNRPGWTVRKRLGRFADDKERELNDIEKKEIDGIVDWVENGGTDVDEWEIEDLSDFFKKIYKDSWEIDQAAFEVSWTRRGIPYRYKSADGATIRLAETFDDRDEYLEHGRENGYLPKYVDIWKNQIYHYYYPWQMCVGMRNVASNVKNNGYSVSELETLIQIVTWMLFGMQYNGNFFQQGSNPKGLLNFKNIVDPVQLEAFKQSWRNTMTGVQNSHKMAVTSGADVEWVNFQQTNKDMEFHQWNEFLTVIACVVFRIDPDEVGFHLMGNKGILGQDGQKERLKHSKEKGLEPFLRYWENQLDQYWIKPLTKGKYEFKFTGINIEDEQVVLDRDIKILQNGGMSAQDFFLKYSARELDQKKDIILNAIYLQYRNAQQYGSPESNQAVDQMNGEEGNNPFDQFEQMRKAEGDPFYKAFDYYLKNGFKTE